MHALLINSNISEGPVNAFFYLGAVLKCGLATSSSCGSLTACNIQTPPNIQRTQMRLKKNVNYFLLNFIISLTF